MIAAVPRCTLFLRLVEAALATPRGAEVRTYEVFLRQFGAALRAGLRDAPALATPLRSVWGGVYVLKQRCSHDAGACHDGLDRYGLCCYIYDGDDAVVKVRYSDYTRWGARGGGPA